MNFMPKHPPCNERGSCNNSRRIRHYGLSTRPLPHRLDQSRVYHTFEVTNPSTRWEPEALAIAISKILCDATVSTAILFAELQSNNNEIHSWLLKVVEELITHHEEVEVLLNKQVKSKEHPYQTLHFGVVKHTLYLWRRDAHPDNWLNIYAYDPWHFRTLEQKHYLMNCTRENLGLTSDYQLAQLIKQLTGHPGKLLPPKTPLNDLHRSKTHFRGESLQLLLDATAHTVEDIQPHLAHIGRGTHGRGRIRNPCFPPQSKLNDLRARICSIIASDGHLNQCRQIIYTEKDYVRLQYVKNLFRQLGDIDFTEINHTSYTHLIIPAVVGRVIEKWGIPVGDKAIIGIRLPPIITKGTPRVRSAYLEELIPEDGSFTWRHYLFANMVGPPEPFYLERAVFEWSRSIVLDVGAKARHYQFKTEITSELKQFLRHYGQKQTSNYGVTGQRASKVSVLKWGRLQQLVEELNDNPTQKIAKQLVKVVWANPPKLMKDEVEICRSLGITTRQDVSRISLYGSGRVSVRWRAQTTTEEAAFRWALLAPPSTDPKRASVCAWLSRNKEKAMKFLEMLRKEELLDW